MVRCRRLSGLMNVLCFTFRLLFFSEIAAVSAAAAADWDAVISCFGVEAYRFLVSSHLPKAGLPSLSLKITHSIQCQMEEIKELHSQSVFKLNEIAISSGFKVRKCARPVRTANI